MKKPHNIIPNENYLYVLSDDEIIEGDWCYLPKFGMGIAKIIHNRLCYYAEPRHEKDGSYTTPIEGWVLNKIGKILATDDPNLGKCATAQFAKEPVFQPLPQIPQSLVEYYHEHKPEIIELEYDKKELWDADELLSSTINLKLADNEVVWVKPSAKQDKPVTMEDFRQDFFISDDGYINIRLKVTTEDKAEREKLVHELMGKVYKDEGFELPKNAVVDQMYFHNQNPLTVLKDLKEQVIGDIESIFNAAIDKRE